MNPETRDFRREIQESYELCRRCIKLETKNRAKFHLLSSFVFVSTMAAVFLASQANIPVLRFVMNFLVYPQFCLLFIGVFFEKFELKNLATPVFVHLIQEIFKTHDQIRRVSAVRRQVQIKVETLQNVYHQSNGR